MRDAIGVDPIPKLVPSNTRLLLTPTLYPPRHSPSACADFFRLLAPHPGEQRAALGAGALSGQMVGVQRIPRALDQQCAAMGAVGVLIVLRPSGDVPGIHMLQPSLLANLSRAHQRSDRGGRRVGHLVVRVKGGHVPGDIGRNGGDEARRIH